MMMKKSITPWTRLVMTTAALLVSIAFVSLVPTGAFADNDNDDKDKKFCKIFREDARQLCEEYCEDQRCQVRERSSCAKLRAKFLKETGYSFFPCDRPAPTASPTPGGGNPTPTATPTNGNVVPTATATGTTIVTPFPPTATPTAIPPGAAAFGVTVVGQYPVGEGDFNQATVNVSDPSGAVVMPFDATNDRASFQFVSRIGITGDDLIDLSSIATHWSYWSEDGFHLADVFICLGPNSSVVVDATAIRGQDNGVPIGATIDLTGNRGIVIVTAYERSMFACGPVDAFSTLERQLVGSWSILNLATNVTFGGNAIGSALFPDPGFPDPALLDPLNAGSLVVQSLNPQLLSDSEVILIGLQVEAGSGAFADTEIGPIRQPMLFPGGGTARVCCDASYTNSDALTISLPDVCFAGAGFQPISLNTAEPGETPIIPFAANVDSSGFLRLANCIVADDLGFPLSIVDAPLPEFIFAFHGQAFGQ